MKIICSICARGGSKGLPGKNWKMLNGIPLIAHSIIQARESGLFSHIAVSSDSQEVLRVAKEFGADILVNRPKDLALDHSPKIPVIRHCLQEAESKTGNEFEVVVDLDATSPLRDVADIKGALNLLLTENASNVITGCPARRSPYFNMVEEREGRVKVVCAAEGEYVKRRQDTPPCYDMNASIYIWRRDILLQKNELFLPETKLFVMDEEKVFDVDSEFDFRLVEFILNSRKKNESH